MPAPVLNEAKPLFDPGEKVAENMSALRDNVTWLVAMAALGISVPPWNATPYGSDLAEPDYVEIEHAIDGRKVKATLTWTDGSVTTMALSFDDGGGYAAFALGTASISYNASGQWTGTTWA